MKSVKEAHNGIRLLKDLRADLGFSDNSRNKVNFTSAVRKLASQGYVDRVFVCREANPSKKYYCIKFIKDLPADYENDDSDGDEDGEFDEFNEDTEDAARPPVEDDDKDTTNIQDLTTVVVESSNSSRARMLFNLYYSLECQMTSFIQRSELQGIPGVELTSRLTGSAYHKITTRLLNLLTGSGTLSQAKLTQYTSKPSGYLVIIRGVDFSARVKFYRYFTNDHYTEFSEGQALEVWGEFSLPDQPSKTTFAFLNRKAFVPIPRLSVIKTEGSDSPFGPYGGTSLSPFARDHQNDSDVSAPNTPLLTFRAKRGRPRKSLLSEVQKSEADDTPDATPTSTPQKKRGRPRNSVAPETPKEDAIKAEAPPPVGDTPGNDSIDLPVPKKRRGRPRKHPMPELTAPTTNEVASSETTNGDEAPASVVKKRLQAQENLPESPSTKRLRRSTRGRSSTPDSANQSTLDSFFSTPSKPVSIKPDTDKKDVDDTMDVDLPSNEPPAALASTETETAPSTEVSNDTKEELTSESQISEAIQAAKEKEKVSTKVKPISFSMQKRVNQVLQLLKENKGYTSGGMDLVNSLNSKFSQENNSIMDKKTVMKVVSYMEEIGAIWQEHFSKPSSKGRLIWQKSVIFSKDIAKDDPIVQQAKDETLNEVRIVINQPQLRVEQSDFKLYDAKLRAIELKRKEARKARIMARMQNRSKSEKRLQAKDQSTAVIKRRRRVTLNPTNNVPSKTTRKGRTSLGGNLPDADPLLSLPLEHRDIRNSKRSSLPRKRHSIATSTVQERRPRQSVPRNISNDLMLRLVVISRSLYGGGSTIYWEKVAEAFPGLTAHAARSIWANMRVTFGNINKLVQITRNWERVFLQAYEAGEIPVAKNNDFDLLFLARLWARKYPRLHDQMDVPLLYEDREANYEHYELEPIEQSRRQEHYFTATSMVKVENMLVQSSAAYEKNLQPVVATEVSKAKVAIKAIIATPDADYDADLSKEILDNFGKEACAEATREMDHERSICFIPSTQDNKQVTERNFMFSDKFMSALNTKLGDSGFYHLDRFYDELMQTLRDSKGYIMARVAPDPPLVCVLDMICTEKVDLVRVNSLEQAFGAFHNSRNIDKNQLECDIVVRTPLRFVESGKQPYLDNVERPAEDENPVPNDGPCSNIWVGVTGKISAPILRNLVTWALAYIETRPGVSADLIHRQIRFILSREEVDSLLGWLERQNCIKLGVCDGYWVRQGWYAHTGVA